MSVLELENAVSQLPSEEHSRFAAWFEECLSDAWDRQIERDVAAGKFEQVICEVDAAIEAGLSTPLPR